MTLDPDKLVLIVIGLIVSMITYFIKKESKKLQDLGDDLRSLQNELTKNTTCDKFDLFPQIGKPGKLV